MVLTKHQAILEQVSFTVNQGEFIGLLGPNGAGKSSLLRCIYRYIKPSKGQVSYQGQAYLGLSATRLCQQLAVVLQDSPSHFNLSVNDVVELGYYHEPLFGIAPIIKISSWLNKR